MSKSANQGLPTLEALKSREVKWKAALDSADKAGFYTSALEGWTDVALAGMRAHRATLATPEGQARADSWINALSGLGTTRDRAYYAEYVNDAQLDFATLEALYHNDDMAARIVDSVPEQMFREGYELVVNDDVDAEDTTGEKPRADAADEGEADDIEAALENLEADDKLEAGYIWARLYGGGGVIVGVDDGQNDEKPVNEEDITAVRYLEPIDRYSLFPVEWYSKKTDPKLGQPSVYQIFMPPGSNPSALEGTLLQAGTKIHETRLILFPGARTSIRRKRANWGWDDSVLQRVYAILMKFGLDWASATHLLSDASQGVLKLKGYIDAIGMNQEAEIAKRAELFDLYRSTLRTVILDSEGEEFTRVATPFTGIPEMLDRTAQRLAAAARMPLTVLMGTSPAGLNATGDSDIRNWYDQIASAQRRILKPRLKRLIKLIMLSKEGPTGGVEKDVEICFRPLWQLTPLEEATRRLSVAQADSIYIKDTVVTAEEIGTSRFGARGYSPETTINLKLREDLQKDDAQKAQLGAEKQAADREAAAAALVPAPGDDAEDPAAPPKEKP